MFCQSNETGNQLTHVLLLKIKWRIHPISLRYIVFVTGSVPKEMLYEILSQLMIFSLYNGWIWTGYVCQLRIIYAYINLKYASLCHKKISEAGASCIDGLSTPTFQATLWKLQQQSPCPSGGGKNLDTPASVQDDDEVIAMEQGLQEFTALICRGYLPDFQFTANVFNVTFPLEATIPPIWKRSFLPCLAATILE